MDKHEMENGLFANDSQLFISAYERITHKGKDYFLEIDASVREYTKQPDSDNEQQWPSLTEAIKTAIEVAEATFAWCTRCRKGFLDDHMPGGIARCPICKNALVRGLNEEQVTLTQAYATRGLFNGEDLISSI